MSIFIPPKITSSELSGLTLQYGEIVFNESDNNFYTGNGTSGGTTLFSNLKTSDIQNDSGYITSASVPSKTSDIQNDSGFITSASIRDLPFGRDYRYNTTTENFEVAPTDPAVIQFSSEDVITDGVLNLAVTSTKIESTYTGNIMPTIEVMIPYSADISTFNITGVDFTISLPDTIQFTSGATNYAVFTCRFIPYSHDNSTNQTSYKTQLNYAYSFK